MESLILTETDRAEIIEEIRREISWIQFVLQDLEIEDIEADSLVSEFENVFSAELAKRMQWKHEGESFYYDYFGVAEPLLESLKSLTASIKNDIEGKQAPHVISGITKYFITLLEVFEISKEIDDYALRQNIKNMKSRLEKDSLAEGSWLLELAEQKEIGIRLYTTSSKPVYCILNFIEGGFIPVNLENQNIEIEVFLDTNNHWIIKDVQEKLNGLATTFSFISMQLSEEPGSWFGRMLFKAKIFLSSERTHDRLQEIEFLIRQATAEKQIAINDKEKANAIAELIKSIEPLDNAALRIGSILIVKYTGDLATPYLMAYTLTSKQLRILEEKPELLKSPANIMDRLNGQVHSSKLKA